mmetsp:Transcript_31683/g.72054  ORF Transcript_31683/g.72054 Transcript_31683/m.72054 type:complete len:220 (+) Transcript_31683:166-825(+)
MHKVKDKDAAVVGLAATDLHVLDDQMLLGTQVGKVPVEEEVPAHGDARHRVLHLHAEEWPEVSVDNGVSVQVDGPCSSRQVLLDVEPRKDHRVHEVRAVAMKLTLKAAEVHGQWPELVWQHLWLRWHVSQFALEAPDQLLGLRHLRGVHDEVDRAGSRGLEVPAKREHAAQEPGEMPQVGGVDHVNSGELPLHVLHRLDQAFWAVAVCVHAEQNTVARL